MDRVKHVLARCQETLKSLERTRERRALVDQLLGQTLEEVGENKSQSLQSGAANTGFLAVRRQPGESSVRYLNRLSSMLEQLNLDENKTQKKLVSLCEELMKGLLEQEKLAIDSQQYNLYAEIEFTLSSIHGLPADDAMVYRSVERLLSFVESRRPAL